MSRNSVTFDPTLKNFDLYIHESFLYRSNAFERSICQDRIFVSRTPLNISRHGNLEEGESAPSGLCNKFVRQPRCDQLTYCEGQSFWSRGTGLWQVIHVVGINLYRSWPRINVRAEQRLHSLKGFSVFLWESLLLWNISEFLSNRSHD